MIFAEFGDQVYVIYEQAFEEVLTNISPVGKKFPEEALRKLLVFQRLSVTAVPRRELPLYNLALVIDGQVKFESVMPGFAAWQCKEPSSPLVVSIFV